MPCTMKLLMLLAHLVMVMGQYETHTFTSAKANVTPLITVTETVHRTHPIRVISTSDVWVTETTDVQQLVTLYSTIYSFIPGAPNTVTSIVRVTSTPVTINTIEIMRQSTRTLISVFTTFSTVTETVNYWQSITHVSVVHSVETVPVWSTQTLIQDLSTTITQIITTVVTSTTRSYM